MSAGELAANFYFKTSNGVEPINGNTAKAKVKNGIVDWFFKYEGPFNKYGYHSMLVGFKSGKSWSYCWGTSTTMTSDITWRQTAVVLVAMEKLTGNLIYFTREFN